MDVLFVRSLVLSLPVIVADSDANADADANAAHLSCFFFRSFVGLPAVC